MKFYNTLTRKKETFKPLNPPGVGLYSCGPTVYDYAHIGHARTYVFVDTLKRALQYFDFGVKHVLNITDVGHLTSEADTGEDKMEKGARREGKTVWEIADFYTADFFSLLGKMNIIKPDIIAKATDHIAQMIKLVKELEIRKFTYKGSDGVYFDTSKFPDYPKLAKLDVAGLQEGARVEKNPEKKNPTDFALWKFSPQGRKRQMEWQSPWGMGFPGWHIECSAMSMEYLGTTIDIHTGGVEHIPVHHTNEIAQSQAATGKTFVNYWLHANHLLVDGKKMSKSLGNFYRLVDLERKGFKPLALRYLFLTAHYRSLMDFTWQSLSSAQTAYQKLRHFVEDAGGRTTLSGDKMAKIEKFQTAFSQYLADDLDFPSIMALVWEVVKSNIPDIDKRDLLLDWDSVLGLDLAHEEKKAIPQEILQLARDRENLRKEDRWDEADKLRQEIEAKGYKIEDTKKGTEIKKID